MDIGVPYDRAAEMPLDQAAALLSDERLDNTHQQKPSAQQSAVTTQTQSNGFSTSVTKTYVTNVRKHSKPKG